MKVRAKELGFYGGVRVKAGTVFELAEGVKLGKWMEKVASDEPETGKKSGKKVASDEPETMSEITKKEGLTKADKVQAS